jgi:hypothetical protein
MAKFLIHFTNPEVGEPFTEEKIFYDTVVGISFEMSASANAHEYAYQSKNGPFTIDKI